MTTIDRQCLVYFSNAIQSEKQTELSSVSISDLSGYLASAHATIRRHIKAAYNGDLVDFLKHFPEVYQLEGNTRVFLTSDIIKMHGFEALERMSVEFFKNKLKSLNAYHDSAVPLLALKKCLGEAPIGVQSLMTKNYPGKDIKRFLLVHSDVFGVSNSGNVYLVGEAPKPPLDDCNFQDYWPPDVSCMDGEISKDEADTVQFFCRVLNSPGIELQSCSVDSLFAQVCEAPDNVQHFVRSNYTEVNFLDFFRAHKSSFAVATESPAEVIDGDDQQASDTDEFPPLTTPRNDYSEPHADVPWESSRSCNNAVDAETAAVKFFEDVIKARMKQNDVTHVDQLQQHLADAPLIVFSYIGKEYPYGKFDKFFLDHADYFSIESSGIVELSVTVRNQAVAASNCELAPHSSSSSTSEGRVSGNEDNPSTWHARNVQLEKQLEKFFLDVFHLAGTYGVRVVKPETALEISSCLNHKLTGYLSEHYGKNVVEFFQHYQNHFRVSKNGNICLAAEKDSNLDAGTKKQPNVLAVDFYVELMQLLEAHQVKAISPEVLWSFLALTPPKVYGLLNKVYTKDTFKSFFLKSPSKFAMSKSKNVYLSSNCPRRDSSDIDEYDFERASENTHEASALEYFVDLVKSLRVNTYPVPIGMLQENLAKASSFVKDYFEDVYPQDKFVNFFLKYDDFFCVLKPISVVWLTKLDGADITDADTEPCPLDNMPGAFRLVVGVVAAALLVKSPKPFSTILGHLNVVKDQYSQELTKQPGKSKTEKLCSLVSNCFDMFKIVKDNAILSWPLKYANSLLSVLEDALAEVCMKLAAGDVVEVSVFHTNLRRNTERLFQCLVPDVKAMVEFLRRRSEFFVLSKEYFIAISKSALPDVEEIAQMVEKELLKCAYGKAQLVSVLETLRDEGFHHSYTSSAVLQAILMCKDRFEVCDDLLLLREKRELNSQKPITASSNQDDTGACKKPVEAKCTPVNGMGWIISLDAESGLLAATFGSCDDYAEVVFKKDALSATSTNFNHLIVGQEVEFIAVKDSPESEWGIVELRSAGSTPCDDTEETAKSGQGDRVRPRSGGNRHSDMSDAASDDNTSTNGDDCIFYSSASDSEPAHPAAAVTTQHGGEDILCVTSKGEPTEATQKDEEATEESFQDARADVTITGCVDAIEDLDPIEDIDEWNGTPYDRRLLSLNAMHRAKRPLNPCAMLMKIAAAAEEGSEKCSQAIAEFLSVPRSMAQNLADITPQQDTSQVQHIVPSNISAASTQQRGTAGDEALKGSLGGWTGSAIWDIEAPLIAVGGKGQEPQESPTHQVLDPVEKAAKGGNLPGAQEVNAKYVASLSPSASSRASSWLSSLKSGSCKSGPSQAIGNLCGEANAVVEGLHESGGQAAACDLEQELSTDEEPDEQHSLGALLRKQALKSTNNHLVAGDGPHMLHFAMPVNGSVTNASSRAIHWGYDDVLPFSSSGYDNPDLLYSVPATVVLVTPTVAILKSSVQGVPVKLIADPEASASLNWSELHTGKKVAARALGNVEDSVLLLVVELHPLWSRRLRRGAFRNAATQTISTGPVLAASLLVE